MEYLQQLAWRKIQKEELSEKEMRDLIDFLNSLKEELRKLRIILYAPFGDIVDFDVVFRES